MTLMRGVVLRVHLEDPDLTARLRFAILTYIPELAEVIGPVPKTLTGKPTTPRTRNCGQYCTAEPGGFAAAIGKLTWALETAPEDPDLWFNRGVALQAAGERDAAVADYRHALALPGADRIELLGKLAELNAE